MSGLRITLSMAALVCFGCAASVRQNAGGPGPDDVRQMIDAEHCFERAVALEKIGAHLEAGIYFDAALRYGGDEKRILPLLVAAQVRAGQLRAAKKNVSRLLVIDENRPEILELDDLLAKLVSQDDGHYSTEDAQ